MIPEGWAIAPGSSCQIRGDPWGGVLVLQGPAGPHAQLPGVAVPQASLPDTVTVPGKALQVDFVVQAGDSLVCPVFSQLGQDVAQGI